MSIADLIQWARTAQKSGNLISPVREVDGLRILKRLHDAKVIDFPRRR